MSRWTKGHIDRSTGQNKRVKVTQREHTDQTPERFNGHIRDRAATARQQNIARALRRRSR